MAGDAFDKYLSEINEAYLRGDATEHTQRPARKTRIGVLGEKNRDTNFGVAGATIGKGIGSSFGNWYKNCVNNDCRTSSE